MIRLFTTTPELLKPGDYVKFIGRFTDYIKDGSTFKIERVQQITYELPVILPPNDATLLDMSNETTTSLGLYPNNIDTLYEILLGLKGSKSILLYIQIPAGKYFARLEKPELFPNPLIPQLRYISPISCDVSPHTMPKLRIHAVKDLEPVILQLYNDLSDYAKVVLHFLINRCRIVEVPPEEAKVVREIWHYEKLRW